MNGRSYNPTSPTAEHRRAGTERELEESARAAALAPSGRSEPGIPTNRACSSLKDLTSRSGETIHVLRLSTRSTARIGEILLVWVLVGSCGIPMMGFMGFALVHPVDAARLTGFPPGSPFQAFTIWAFLGMSVTATLGGRLRGTCLIAPAIAWSIFFAGATAIHLCQYAELGGLSHKMMLTIFATHGMISVLLLGGFAASGVGRPLSTPTTDAVME